MVYSIRAKNVLKESIAFRATGDADVKTLYWFVDNKHIGRSSPEETLFWNPKPGVFRVRVVDDQGRYDVRQLEVEVVE